MSWQAYIDSSLVGSGHVAKGAIISSADYSIWASSTDFKPTPAESKIVADIFGGNAAAKDKAFADGLYIAGQRYVMARVDDAIYARSGKEGIVIAKSKQAFIIGFHDETQVAGNTSSTVVGLATYLTSSGY